MRVFTRRETREIVAGIVALHARCTPERCDIHGRDQLGQTVCMLVDELRLALPIVDAARGLLAERGTELDKRRAFRAMVAACDREEGGWGGVDAS